MASLDDRRTLERQRFFDGQRLLAADLDEVVADHRFRRELHNRSLHQPGIGNGFAVSGEPGAREVTIGPGYALDAYGREIISTRTRVEPVPPVAGDPTGGPARYDLTVAYPSGELEEAETREGVCTERGVVRLAEEPDFCWVRLEEDAAGELHPADPRLAAEIDGALKIRLARVEVEHCRLKALSVAQRRNARPATQPFIACGHAQPVWVPDPIADEMIFFSLSNVAFSVADLARVSLAAAGTEQPFFLVADVDTSAASFRATPCYSAGLRGPRLVSAPGGGGGVEGVEDQVEIAADGLVTIEDPTPNGFRIRVLPVLLVDGESAANFDWSQVTVPWTVAWMGVEG